MTINQIFEAVSLTMNMVAVREYAMRKNAGPALLLIGDKQVSDESEPEDFDSHDMNVLAAHLRPSIGASSTTSYQIGAGENDSVA